MKKLVYAAALSFALGSSSWASVPAAQSFLKELLTLADISKSQAGKLTAESKKHIDSLSAQVDFVRLSSVSLGPKWQQITELQRKDFIATLRELIESVLYPKAHKISAKLSDVKFADVPGKRGQVEALTRYEYEKLGDRVVKNIRIVLLYDSKGTRIVDAILEGEQLSSNLRRQFEQALQKKTFQQILDSMKKKVAESKAPPAAAPAKADGAKGA